MRCFSRLSIRTKFEYFSRLCFGISYTFFFVHCSPSRPYLFGSFIFALPLTWELKSSQNACDKDLQSYLRASLKRQITPTLSVRCGTSMDSQDAVCESRPTKALNEGTADACFEWKFAKYGNASVKGCNCPIWLRAERVGWHLLTALVFPRVAHSTRKRSASFHVHLEQERIQTVTTTPLFFSFFFLFLL